MMNDKNNSNTSQGILILDDRKDVLTGTSIFLDSEDILCFFADTMEKAQKALIKNHEQIRVAFIDKVLEDDNGIDFIEKNKYQYSNTDFVLLTAWSLTPNEKKKIDTLNIDVFDKAQFVPEDYIKCLKKISDPSLENVHLTMEKRRRTPKTSQITSELFEERLKSKVYYKQSERLKTIWGKYTDAIVNEILEFKGAESDGILLLEGKSLTVGDLIGEIRNASDLGVDIVELHNLVMTDMLNILKKKKRFRRRLLK